MEYSPAVQTFKINTLKSKQERQKSPEVTLNKKLEVNFKRSGIFSFVNDEAVSADNDKKPLR